MILVVNIVNFIPIVVNLFHQSTIRGKNAAELASNTEVL